MSLGFPNSDMYSDHEEGGSESFWPSFTDIMMVIVMTFLLITVSVILNNWELVNSLKDSVNAEKQATERAKSALQLIQAKSVENETLDNRVIRLEVALRKELSKNTQLKNENTLISLTLKDIEEALIKRQSKITSLTNQQDTTSNKLNHANQELSKNKQEQYIAQQKSTQKIEQLQTEKQQQQSLLSELRKQVQQQSLKEEKQTTQLTQSTVELQALQKKLQTTEQALKASSTEINQIKNKKIDNNQALVSLQGELKTLDQKYQKLLRPARSSKNKHVVKVFLEKAGNRQHYQIADQDKNLINLASRNQLDKLLGKLKSQYGDDLYVKIIIPEGSQISHSEAWRFTRDILKQYDYYSEKN